MRNSILKKRVFVAVASISMAFLILILNGNEILQAAQGLFPPTPPPVTPPPPGVTPARQEAVEPPESKVPSYIMSGPSFAGKVLHWTQVDYSYISTNLDPANGQPVTGEIWVQVGDDGIPIKFHNLYRRQEGTFHQESLQTRDAITVVMGEGYPKPPPQIKPPPRCTTSPWHRSADVWRSLLPLFADDAALARYGFTQNGGLTKQLPSTVSLPGVKPIVTYGSDNNVRRWLLRESADGLMNLKAVELGAYGRVVASEARLVTPKGDSVNETWAAYGILEVYDPISVPGSVFILSQQAQEVCRG